jgi:uncharacterized membrane protein
MSSSMYDICLNVTVSTTNKGEDITPPLLQSSTTNLAPSTSELPVSSWSTTDSVQLPSTGDELLYIDESLEQQQTTENNSTQSLYVTDGLTSIGPSANDDWEIANFTSSLAESSGSGDIGAGSWLNETFSLLNNSWTTSSIVNNLTAYNATDWVISLADSNNQTTTPSLPRDSSTPNTTNYVTAMIGEFYVDFEHVAETYIMTSVALIGLILNCLAIFAISRDRKMCSHILHYVFLGSEQLFLAILIGYLQMRAYIREPQTNVHLLQTMNWLTSAVALSQTLAAWMLYVLATNCYQSVHQLLSTDAHKMNRSSCKYRWNIIIVLVGVVVFYVGYIPPVRLALFTLNQQVSTLCNVPYQNHWNFEINEVTVHNVFYILYYSLSYIIIAHLAPFFAIACRDKDIIDVVHNAQDRLQSLGQLPDAEPENDTDLKTKLIIPITTVVRPGSWSKKAIKGEKIFLPEVASRVMCPAVATSVICNIYLVCAALKLVILTFKIFQFSIDFVYGTAAVFFRYLNVYSNFLLILKSSLHFGIMMLYNRRLRQIMSEIVQRLFPCFQRRHTSGAEYDDEVDDSGSHVGDQVIGV